MIRFILVITFISLIQTIVSADSSKINATVIHSKAIVTSTKIQQKMSGHTDNQKWTQDQTKQLELEKKYKKAIAEDPENKKNYAYLAGLYLSNSMTSKAISAYQEAIMHDTENPKLFAAISIAYLHKAKYGMAKAMADEALRLDPKLTQVGKIHEYIAAKQAVIEAASKISAGAEKPAVSDVVPHGSVMPTSTFAKPSDIIHNPK